MVSILTSFGSGIQWCHLLLCKTPKIYKNRIWKGDVINGYDFGYKNTPFGGQKLSYWLEILYTVRRLVAE